MCCSFFANSVDSKSEASLCDSPNGLDSSRGIVAVNENTFGVGQPLSVSCYVYHQDDLQACKASDLGQEQCTGGRPTPDSNPIPYTRLLMLVDRLKALGSNIGGETVRW
ncbi:hypothetical protein N7475_007577 [Penicillium sp. IBT 31633x]|nr:hypothetical protein N7475_007577 [Penicillium sp. IBT 31633x]